jgi:hypothetical protein
VGGTLLLDGGGARRGSCWQKPMRNFSIRSSCARIITPCSAKDESGDRSRSTHPSVGSRHAPSAQLPILSIHCCWCSNKQAMLMRFYHQAFERSLKENFSRVFYAASAIHQHLMSISHQTLAIATAA